jgi:hypothetical protein
METKNNILPEIKKFKDKRKIFKQSYLLEKEKIGNCIANAIEAQ